MDTRNTFSKGVTEQIVIDHLSGTKPQIECKKSMFFSEKQVEEALTEETVVQKLQKAG